MLSFLIIILKKSFRKTSSNLTTTGSNLAGYFSMFLTPVGKLEHYDSHGLFLRPTESLCDVYSLLVPVYCSFTCSYLVFGWTQSSSEESFKNLLLSCCCYIRRQFQMYFVVVSALWFPHCFRSIPCFLSVLT